MPHDPLVPIDTPVPPPGHVSPAAGHRHLSPSRVEVYLVTCSDTVHEGSDVSGKTMRNLLSAAGHGVVGQEVIPDEAVAIEASLERARKSGAKVVLFSGGTGFTARDVTADVLGRLYEKEMPGFGELFRMLSFQEIGSAAMLSRASAGVSRGQVLFALPGSTHAVKMALEKLILPELGHLVRELSR